MKRQRNIQQIKEHDKNPLNQTKEETVYLKKNAEEDSKDDPKS